MRREKLELCGIKYLKCHLLKYSKYTYLHAVFKICKNCFSGGRNINYSFVIILVYTIFHQSLSFDPPPSHHLKF